LQRAADSGVTILLIEQFVHRALELANHCVILRQGAVAWAGPSDQAHQEVLDTYLGETSTAMS
jgi:branched-chain amino acid transport system ATP-binding protein